MPGVRWGSDITDEAATRVRAIDDLERKIASTRGEAQRRNLMKNLTDIKANTASIFGTENAARTLAKKATYDGDTAKLPKWVRDANPNQRARPALSKSEHAMARRAGAQQRRATGFGAVEGKNPGSAYSVGRAGRTSARNPVGREGANPLAPMAERTRNQNAARIVDNAKRASRADTRAGRAPKPKKAAKPRAPRKPKAS